MRSKFRMALNISLFCILGTTAVQLIQTLMHAAKSAQIETIFMVIQIVAYLIAIISIAGLIATRDRKAN
jgi:predicted membrane channel-forming protein YqfA (hemolysin III family)